MSIAGFIQFRDHLRFDTKTFYPAKHIIKCICSLIPGKQPQFFVRGSSKICTPFMFYNIIICIRKPRDCQHYITALS